MAEKKPSGFRFRLPWLLQPSLAPRTVVPPEPPTQPPRTTTQTSTSAQRPPFRPPGKAPSPPPASPKRSPVSVATPPPPVPPKTPDPVATLPVEETQTATKTIPTAETSNLTSPPEVGKTDSETQTQPTTETSSPKTETPPAIVKVVDTVETQPTSETRKTDETIPTIETPRPITPPQRPTSPPKAPSPPKPDSRPSFPSQFQVSSDTVSTSRMPDPPQINSQPLSPSRVSDNTPEIKRSTEIPDLDLDAKPKAITKAKGAQTRSMNPNSMDKIQETTKSHKTKPKTIAAQVSLHREIKDDISKFVHKIATSPSKQYTDEKPAATSVVTLAGDNKGASMQLHSDGKKPETDSKTGENQEAKASVNSNVQGINNSLMLNTSVKERNPGVHVVFSRDMANTDESKMKKTESMDMNKAEADITPPKTVVYEPAIGSSRGGVFMDQSDSDQDDREMSISAKDYEIEVL